MKVKNIIEYDIVNYKCAAMFIGFPYCSFKCNYECGQDVCQNSALAKENIIELSSTDIIYRYLFNPLTHAIVCGGLEPFDTFEDLKELITEFRDICEDPIIIYTGYYENEIQKELNQLIEINQNSTLPGALIVKFGRFIPNMPHRYDEVLGVELASDNQYAKIWG